MAEEKGLEGAKAPIEMVEEVPINPSGHRQQLNRNFFFAQSLRARHFIGQRLDSARRERRCGYI